MKIKLVAFGIAKDLLKQDSMEIQSGEFSDIGGLKDLLCKKYAGFAELKHFRMAVNEEYRDDDFSLKEADEVIIIPPVSGG